MIKWQLQPGEPAFRYRKHVALAQGIFYLWAVGSNLSSGPLNFVVVVVFVVVIIYHHCHHHQCHRA